MFDIHYKVYILSMLKINKIFFIFLILSSMIVLSSFVPSFIPSSKSIFAQSETNTIKSRNLIIDLGNGINRVRRLLHQERDHIQVSYW